MERTIEFLEREVVSDIKREFTKEMTDGLIKIKDDKKKQRHVERRKKRKPKKTVINDDPKLDNKEMKVSVKQKILNLAWSNSSKHKKTIKSYVEKGDAILLDGFDADKELVEKYKKEGLMVIGYISVGSTEDWRPDIQSFPSTAVGGKYDGWDGERWLKVDNWEELKGVMSARFDMLVKKGFDGYEGDNIQMESKDNKGKTKKNIEYAKWLADEAHSKGLLAFLKNGGSKLVDSVVDNYDGVIIESAIQYNEVELYKKFYNQGKPTWFFEYDVSKSDIIKNKQEWMSDVFLDTSSGWERI